MSMTTDEQFELIALIGELDFSLTDHPEFVQLLCNTRGESEALDAYFSILQNKVEKIDLYFEMFEFLVKKFYKEDPLSLKSIISPYLITQ